MKFTGHERDYAGGFGREDGHVIDYMHARYYNPAMGRFWAVDPIEGNPHNSQSWNRYIYANNTPMVATDLTGLVSSGSAWQWLPERCKLLCDEKKPKKKDPPPADDKTPHSHLSITVTGKDPGWFSAFFFRAGLRAARGYMGRSFTPAEEAALNGQNYAASLLMRGAKPRARILGGPVIIGPIGNFGSDVELVDGFYQVAGSELRFREFYYNRLWATGRPAPFLAAQEVLDTATNIEPDVSLPGFNRYTNGTLEMVYNPSTGEVFHLQPLR
jgi:RHS repeat-associated protein